VNVTNHPPTSAQGTRPEQSALAAEWDTRYASRAQMSSGQPNPALVTELTGVQPGRALDVGCGEGADAIWLAGQGWTVTALDVSQVALERAALRAEHAAAKVEWVHAGLVDALLSPAGFDLVSAQYPALPRSVDRGAERALLEAVAPGGVLLVVYHVGFDGAEAKAHGFNPEDYVLPIDVVAALFADHWQVQIDTRRPREAPARAGPRHSNDVVIRAQRLS
jgi:SAM-dependent methyltransferase